MVTGAFGNVGASTVRALLAAGHRVTALRVTSTDTPRLQVPSGSGGATCTIATSIGR